MSTDLEIRRTGGQFEVWCLKCNARVDLFEIETPLYEVPDDCLGMMKRKHTGEIILTVECHGERWRTSNYTGLLTRS